MSMAIMSTPAKVKLENTHQGEQIILLAPGHAQLNVDDGPAAKRVRLDSDACDIDSDNISSDLTLKQLLFTINKAICMRLECIENRLEDVNIRTKCMEDKIDQIYAMMKEQENSLSFTSNKPMKSGKGAILVGLPHGKSTIQESAQNLGPNVTLITLNTEDDYPNGSWLGDENNPEMRVRTPITPSDLIHIHSNCRTAEKMALTMLDYLFDRDTQAMSNLSGQGKHGKKQLDPLFIYGIRCHLIHRFGLTESDWQRIKLNIDSKCRTAFRRKVRGLSLSVKAFRGKNPYLNPQGSLEGHADLSLNSDDSMQNDDEGLHIHQHRVHTDVEVQGAVSLQGHELPPGGEIQVLHATPEQLAQLQQTHQIQILQGTQVIQHVAVSLPRTDGIDIEQLQDEVSGVSVSLASNDCLNQSGH